VIVCTAMSSSASSSSSSAASSSSSSSSASSTPDLSAAGLAKSDSQLKDLDLKKYSATASSADVETTVAGLEKKGHKVTVVSDAAAALETLSGLLAKDKNVSVGFAGSTTLQEIGFIDYVKTRTDLTNYRELGLVAQGKGDHAGSAKYRALGITADFYFTSVAAVTLDGELLTCDLTGNRVAGLFGAQNAIVVVGTNKIVKDTAAGEKRMYDYQTPLESARARIAYASWGVKGSQVNNMAWLKGANPFGAKGRVHVIVVKGSYGF